MLPVILALLIAGSIFIAQTPQAADVNAIRRKSTLFERTTKRESRTFRNKWTTFRRNWAGRPA
jgi:hypothetical protein